MDKKESIRSAAEALFREKGFHTVSVRDIGKAVGVGASAVSYYFGSKAALYHAIFPEEDHQSSDAAERIRQAATKLFAAEGYEKVSIRDLAKAAGVNSAAISYYFGGKAELYRQVLYEGTSMISEFIEAVEKEKPDPPGIVKLYGQFLVRLGQERPEVLRLIFWEMMNGSAVFNAFVHQRLSMVMDIVRKAVADGIEQGFFRKNLQPQEVCISWIGMILFFFLSKGIHEALCPEHGMNAMQYMEATWRLFMDGARDERDRMRE